MPENTINSDFGSIENQSQSYAFAVEGDQWTLEVEETAPGSGIFRFRGYNLDPQTGKKRFFGFDSSGPSGQLLINPEPDLGMPLDKLGFGYKLTGCILINEDGSTADRFSLSKKTFIQGVAVSFDQEGRELEFDGLPSGWYLALLIIKDKNRIKGSDGYFSRTKTEKVIEVELETAANGILREQGLIR